MPFRNGTIALHCNGIHTLLDDGEPVAYVVREQDTGGIIGRRGVFQCSKLFVQHLLGFAFIALFG